MDARPLLYQVARMLEEHGLEAVLIGNAAAALQGAPICSGSCETTMGCNLTFGRRLSGCEAEPKV